MTSTEQKTSVKEKYTATFWTTIGQIVDGKHVTHDHWVVLNEDSEVVAAGGEKFCKDYATELNKKVLQ